MSGGLEIGVNLAQFRSLGNMVAAAGEKAELGLARAVNHTGAKARTAMIRALVPQTGLKAGTVRRALTSRQMWPGKSGAFVIRSRGGDIRLKFFGARETQSGVSAAPWNRRQVYAHTFIQGGRFPGRVPLAMGGQVFVRAGSSRLPLQNVRSGLYIAEEMVSGQSRAAFDRVVAEDLPNRLGHELGRLLGG